MAFNPKITYNPSLSVEDNIKAIVNWLNFCLREMTVGRVPSETDARAAADAENREALEEALAGADETAIALYEAQEAQETINAQQDEALMEIYEMIG